ncbi:MAG: 5-oxoprolinase subunit PxpB [Deltaproteobacteria bacterium]|nr:5-oxoprolinase subunit PxpB [Deltaproteobacteria bacterium]
MAGARGRRPAFPSRRAELRRVGEWACLLEVESLEAAHAAYATLRSLDLGGVRDLVAGARSVLVVFAETPDESALRAIESATDPRELRVEPGRTHEIAVRYGGSDLDDVARRAGLARNEVVRRHAEATYRVAFLGFQPGFAYLDGLPAELHTPRRATPRPCIPAGSVAIGGEWTGVYPAEGPGGWNLIGSTDAVLFDPSRDAPCLFAPGDLVRFRIA